MSLRGWSSWVWEGGPTLDTTRWWWRRTLSFSPHVVLCVSYGMKCYNSPLPLTPPLSLISSGPAALILNWSWKDDDELVMMHHLACIACIIVSSYFPTHVLLACVYWLTTDFHTLAHTHRIRTSLVWRRCEVWNLQQLSSTVIVAIFITIIIGLLWRGVGGALKVGVSTCCFCL